MAIIMKSNLVSFRKNIATREKNLIQAGIKSHREAARLMSLKAKKLAPKKSGALIANIKARYGKKTSTVSSRVPGSFPYNAWVNVSPGFEKAMIGFGKNRKSMRYRDTRHTGTPRYFDIAVMDVAKKYPKVVLNQVRIALGAKSPLGGLK